MYCSTCSSGALRGKMACVGKLLIRIAVALVFIYAGYFKLTNTEIVTPMFEEIFGMGWLAVFVGLVEFIGGLLVLVGFQTTLAGALLSIIMVVAIVTSHLGQGFTALQFPLVILLLTLAVTFMDPGRYSVNKCLCSKMCKGGTCGDSSAPVQQ